MRAIIVDGDPKEIAVLAVAIHEQHNVAAGNVELAGIQNPADFL